MPGLTAEEYWQSYYAEDFIPGLGTEEILALLRRIPPVTSWLDLGAGSESLLWGTSIRANELIAVDLDPERLQLLRRCAATPHPRGAYRTALSLSGLDASAWPKLGRRLTETHQADCLNGQPLALGPVDLVTQFGLLGLCRDVTHFRDCFSAAAALARPGGFLAGANWVARDLTGRVELRADDYLHAMDAADAQVIHLEKITSADPEYPFIWLYLGQRRPTAAAQGALGAGPGGLE